MSKPIIKLRLLLVCMVGLIFSAQPAARMYQWRDAATGTTQLAGKPPAWYRAAQLDDQRNFPRVIVLERGEVVDDTAWQVSEQQRAVLRQLALIKAEESQVDQTAPADNGQAAGGADQSAADSGLDIEPDTGAATATEPLADAPSPAAAATAPEPNPDLEAGQSAEDRKRELQALISAWEAERAEQAQELLERLDEDNR